jgi:hypothetical protein
VKHKQCNSDEYISNKDNPQRSAMGFYIQWKEGERELGSRETERECVRGRALRSEGVASVQRSAINCKHVTEICKLISEINDADNGFVSSTRSCVSVILITTFRSDNKSHICYTFSVSRFKW